MQKTALIGVTLVGFWLTYYLFTQGHGDSYKQPHHVVASRINFWDWVRGRSKQLRWFTVAIFVTSAVLWGYQALSFEVASLTSRDAVDGAVSEANGSVTEEVPPEAPVSEVVNLPFAIEAESGTVWSIFGLEIVGKVMSAQTNGEYAVVTTTTPPNGGPPLHVHQREDEMFYVIQGTYEFRLGDETVVAAEGDIVHLPRSVPHRFRNVGTEPGTTMNLIIPGGFEQFFAEIDQLPKEQPLDRQQVADIARQYGLEFLPDES